MPSQTPRPLGILSLERGRAASDTPPPSPPGGLLNPATFEFPVISETIAGAWAEVVVRGDPALDVERGAVAITSNCGFSIRHQAAVAKALKVPVALSSLLLLPTLLRQLPKSAKIAILSYDSTQCGRDLLPLVDPVEQAKVVIGGLEGSKFWIDEQKHPAPPVDVAAIETDVALCVARLRSEYPDITAILFGCTAFPMVAPALRRITKLPIYDITDLCRLIMASVGS
ncbi:hypothetical protein IVB12_01285 [Bradyrhizobium sp. 179]|uniref:hypothetical protein n=1 Tax=Bradyrhizobium sp. 179 TaxID=2782648 RepID=UPI001FFB71CC|nr:hypothetical protein [Bradyrhizobium sp. 179]MCK1540657.1 hypothetical protein [Bradyrhizobium sp. 179]